LRKACEEVITACSHPIYEPLEIWVNQITAVNGPITKPTSSTSPATPSSTRDSYRPKTNTATTAPNLDVVLASTPHAQAQFFEALQRELRPSVVKVKLYLDDARTVKVLLEHVVSRIEAMYERFGDAMFSVRQVGDEPVEIVSSSGLRDILREVCGDDSLSFTGLARS
jgi:hypothetical protein